MPLPKRNISFSLNSLTPACKHYPDVNSTSDLRHRPMIQI